MTTEPHGASRLVGIGIAGIVAVLVASCGPTYPEVSSPKALELLLALHTACSTARADRLEKVADQLDRAWREGKITAQDQEALARIVALARQGRWQEAEKACRQFKKAQVR
jgi:hypothetical protein